MDKKEKVLAVASLAYIIGLFGFLLMLFLCILLEVQGVGNLVLLFLAFLFVGYIVVAIIRMCTYVYKCPKCDISLNYHKASNKLKCHYCGLEFDLHDKCPECGSENVVKYDRIIGYLTAIPNWSRGRQVEQKKRVYSKI